MGKDVCVARGNCNTGTTTLFVHRFTTPNQTKRNDLVLTIEWVLCPV